MQIFNELGHRHNLVQDTRLSLRDIMLLNEKAIK